MAKRIMPSIMWTRGKKIAQEGNVRIDYINNQSRAVEATVFGTSPYGVTVGVDADNDFCECPYFPDHGYCKHIAAVVRLLKSQHRPIEKLFQEVDLFDNFQEKFPGDYVDTSRQFEQQLLAHPEFAQYLYRHKEDYNRLRADPDAWPAYFTNPANIKLVDDTPDVGFAAPKIARHREQKSSGIQFLEQLDLPEVQYFQPLDGGSLRPLELEVTLTISAYGEAWGNQENRFFMRLRVADQTDHKFYMVANATEFLQSYAREETYQTSGKRRFRLSPKVFPEAEQQLLSALTASQEIEPQKFNGSENERRKHLLLNPGTLARLAQLIPKLTTFEFSSLYDEHSFSDVQIVPFKPDNSIFEATVDQTDDGFDLSFRQEYDTVVPADRIIIVGNQFYQATALQFGVISNLLLHGSSMGALGYEYDSQLENIHLHFTNLEIGSLHHFLKYFAQIGRINAPAEMAEATMEPHFDLDKDDQTIVLKLAYDYDGKLVPSYDADQLDSQQRNIDKEQQARQYLESLGFIQVGREWRKTFADPETLYQFFVAELPNLRLNGVVTTSDELDQLLQDGAALTPQINVSENGGLLSVNFSFTGIDETEVDQILNQLDTNRPYVTRADGSLVLLDDRLQKVSKALTNIRAQGQISHGQVHLHAAQALAVQAALNETAEFDAQFQKLTHDLAHPETFDIRHERPVNATLRPYQITGVKWLEMLDSHGFGGILADEMGLGKTLQMITFLNNHLSDQRVDLIISPASLIYNWLEEFKKFAPAIRVAVVDGTKEDRRQLIQDPTIEVLITSYNSARRDIDLYEHRDLNYMVLDEAQFVKNGGTKTNQSLRKLTPKNTFALSGTPIENRAEELWSIFALVMPGLLQSKKAFKKLSPAEIAVRVKPFILRREKQTVLHDLPPKVETNLTNEMTKEQKTVYLAQLKQMQVKVRGLSNDGFVKNKIEILAGLTRLRQICDTPALYMDDYQETSGKLEQLDEILRQAVDSERHVLIFSQFTSMLDIIEQHLHQNDLSAYVLKGDTKPKDRLQMVDAFNAGQKNIFLISLKAGGTGLNLTGADLVILVDLWWNPAVEDQATARAHRIGQKNQVDVYRLITKGTIEEQIYKLQEKKRDFVDQVLSGTENKGSLTDDEIKLILGIQ
jgi:SNF2 family DNA or RNA helicase